MIHRPAGPHRGRTLLLTLALLAAVAVVAARQYLALALVPGFGTPPAGQDDSPPFRPRLHGLTRTQSHLVL